jgi:hypothetical protein
LHEPQFLCLTAAPFLRPDLPSNGAARSDRQGWPSRQPHPKLDLARPRLDGREHGVMIKGKRAAL